MEEDAALLYFNFFKLFIKDVEFYLMYKNIFSSLKNKFWINLNFYTFKNV